MTNKHRITFTQVMAILALIGILLSVVGTTWISQQPMTTTPTVPPLISGEIALPLE